MDKSPELERGLDFFQPKPLIEILRQIKPVATDIPTAEAKQLINSKYPGFNFLGTNNSKVIDMAALVAGLVNHGNEVTELVKSGESKEAFQLAEDVRTIDDPQASYLTTPLKELLVFSGGNINEVTRNLGISALPNAEQWVEFMVRSWGMKPEDFRAVDEVHTEGWKTLVADVRKYIAEKELPQEFIAWPNPEMFKRLYIPEFGALFRGIREMDETKIKEVLEHGMASRLLNKLGSFEAVKNHLRGRVINEEFKRHYGGAGKDEFFWQSPDESPFVALSKWRTIPLWHASRGEKYRIIVELAPKFHSDTLEYRSLEGAPENERVWADGVAGMAFPEQMPPTFEHPFIQTTTEEIAFYPKVDPRDIAKIHLIPSNLEVEGIEASPDVIPYLKNPSRLK